MAGEDPADSTLDAHIDLYDAKSHEWRLKTSYIPGDKLHIPHVVNIDHGHDKIHAGNAYIHSRIDSVANGATLNYLLRGHATTQCHLRLYSYTVADTPCTFTLYEGPTITDAGTAETWQNANRPSSNTPDTLLYSAPTVTGNGTALECILYPDGGGGGAGPGGGTAGLAGADIGEEWIFNDSTDYLMSITNNSGGTIDICHHFFIYEE